MRIKMADRHAGGAAAPRRHRRACRSLPHGRAAGGHLTARGADPRSGAPRLIPWGRGPFCRKRWYAW